MAEMKTLNGYEVVDAKARKDITDTKFCVLDMYQCVKVTDTYWHLTDNVKNILQRLFKGEKFPIAVANYSHILYIPSRVSATSDEVVITLDAGHIYSGNSSPKLVGISTDEYVFTDSEGHLTLTNKRIDVVDYRDYNALEDRIKTLESKVAALEGSN